MCPVRQPGDDLRRYGAAHRRLPASYGSVWSRGPGAEIQYSMPESKSSSHEAAVAGNDFDVSARQACSSPPPP